MPDPPLVLIDVLEEHLEELDFLWATRELSIFSADFRPLHLGRLEERMEAHLDGLREGGRGGIDLCEAALAGDDWSLCAAGAWGLLLRSAPRADMVRAAVEAADKAAALGLRLALRHVDPALWRTDAEHPSPARSPYAEAVWLDALAFHDRRAAWERLAPLLRHDDPAVRAVAWGVRLRAGSPPEVGELRLAIEDEDAAVREAVVIAAARWGGKELREIARQAAERGEERDAEAVRWLGALGEPNDLEHLERALARPAVVDAALAGIGALGDARGVPALLDALAEAERAPAAGAAFAALTGEALGLRPAVVDGENVEVPDVEEGRRMWEERAKDFPAGERWRGGRAAGKMPLAEALAVLDLEGARDAWLRECVTRGGRAPDIELERFARDRGRELRR